MNAWLRAREALTVMDVVMRVWARELLLAPGDVAVLIYLGTYGPQCCRRLALWAGRPRQQVHKSLKALAGRQIVRVDSFDSRGRTQDWALTSKGEALSERLTRRMEAWEAALRPEIVLDDLATQHEALLTALIARPLENGWRKGLRVPAEVRVNPYWDFTSMEEALAWRDEVQRIAAAPLPEEEFAAQLAREAATPSRARMTKDQKDWARAIQIWAALWR